MCPDTDPMSADYKREQSEVVLAPEFDQFYESQMYNNFGELGEAVTRLRDDCTPTHTSLPKRISRRRHRQHRHRHRQHTLSLIRFVCIDLKRREALSEIKETQSLEKLKDFIESDLTDHKKLQQTMSKHVNICDELTKTVTKRKYAPSLYTYTRYSHKTFIRHCGLALLMRSTD